MSMTYFQEQLDYIAAVTRALNAMPDPTDRNFYIHVELREEGTHRKVGSWSDEIASDAWYYSEEPAK